MRKEPGLGIESTIPAYSSLLIYYHPLKISAKELQERLSQLEPDLKEAEVSSFRLIKIPVIYGGEYGPDLDFVALHNNLTSEEVIKKHSSAKYQVFMMGFSPGFPYLSGLPAEISAPRLPNPRLKVKAGSVGIAGSQTGIYPQDTPGGWRIIGWTPLKLYDPERLNPILLEIGDRVCFLPVKEEEAEKEGKLVENELIPGEKRKVRRKSLKAGKNLGSFSVLKGGFFTTVQDEGRFGYQRYGIPVSGALDRYSMALANSLVGNDIREAVLEVTLMGEEVELLFHHPTRVAVVGGKLKIKINGLDFPQNKGLPLKGGEVISLSEFKQGGRAYLAIAGGIQVEKVLGSRSTYTGGNLGGFQGRILQKGDRLNFKIPKRNNFTTSLLSTALNQTSLFNLPGGSPYKVRVVMGPQEDYFTAEGINTFLNSTYEVMPESDRRGLRFSGPRIEPKEVREIISEGTPPGVIQVVGSGLPLIIMKDGPTTGGYPKIATVITADLDLLAQVKAGDRIKFEKISLEEAYKIYQEYEERLRQLNEEPPLVISLREEDWESIIDVIKEKSIRGKKSIIRIDDDKYSIEVEIS